MKNILKSFFCLIVALSFIPISHALVEISGKEEVKIFEEKGEWIVKTQNITWRISKDKDTWILKDGAQKTLLRAGQTPKQEIQLLSESSKSLATLKCENESCRLFEGDNLVLRIKEKSDKTNIYDGKDKRIYKVKTKPYGFSVKHESDNSREWKIKGIKQIKGAALFAAPLPLEQRALLWRAWSP